MNENELLEKKDLRNKYIERIEVLNKVKNIITLPNTELMTTKMIIEYFNVGEEAINSLVKRNSDELFENGMCFKTYGQIKEETKVSDMNTLKISRRGTNVFSKRTVLNIAMLLRDSTIAKEIRTQLLNAVEDKSVQDVMSKNISHEDMLLLNILKAQDDITRAVAVNELNTYKNRHIQKLNETITGLAEGVLTWDSREAINRMVRKIAMKVFRSQGNTKMFVSAWDKLYSEMLYKHNIGVRTRLTNLNKKRANIFDVLDEDELKLAVKSCVALCEMYNIDISDLKVEVCK